MPHEHFSGVLDIVDVLMAFLAYECIRCDTLVGVEILVYGAHVWIHSIFAGVWTKHSEDVTRDLLFATCR